jgi:hypothetical protein
MCELMAAMTVASTALSAAGAVAQHQGQQSATDAYNASAAQNANFASVAATRKYNDENTRTYYDMLSINKEGYKAALRGREASATARASSGSAGVAGLSVDNIYAAVKQQAAENETNVQLKREDRLAAADARMDSYEAEAQGRINSMPYKAGPDPLALGINLASEATKFGTKVADAGGWDKFWSR